MNMKRSTLLLPRATGEQANGIEMGLVKRKDDKIPLLAPHNNQVAPVESGLAVEIKVEVCMFIDLYCGRSRTSNTSIILVFRIALCPLKTFCSISIKLSFQVWVPLSITVTMAACNSNIYG